jgi:hypothetical protein
VSNEIAAFSTIAERLHCLVGLELEDVIAALDLASVGQPVSELQGGAAYQRQRGTYGEVLVVFAHRVRLLRSGQRTIEPGLVFGRGEPAPCLGGRTLADSDPRGVRQIGIKACLKLIGDQTDHQIGSLLEILFGHLVAQGSTTVGVHELAERGGEMIILRKNDFHRCTLDETSPERWLASREIRERSNRPARFGRSRGKSGKQMEHPRLVESEQVPAGECQLGEGDRDWAQQQEVNLDAAGHQFEGFGELPGQVDIAQLLQLDLAQVGDASGEFALPFPVPEFHYLAADIGSHRLAARLDPAPQRGHKPE